jgi:uncharacterized membrane protein
MNYYLSFLLGTQLIGVLFIVIGALQRFLPPKKINRWYGYRTPNARIDQETWDASNRYSAIYMMKLGLLYYIIGTIINTIAALYVADYDKQNMIKYFVLFAGAIGIGVLSTMATEKYLAIKFKNKVKKRRK